MFNQPEFENDMDQFLKSVSRDPIENNCGLYGDRKVSLRGDKLYIQRREKNIGLEIMIYQRLLSVGLVLLVIWGFYQAWQFLFMGALMIAVMMVFFSCCMLGLTMLLIYVVFIHRDDKNDVFIFDKEKNYFYAGMERKRSNPKEVTDNLGNICAIQALKKTITDTSTTVRIGYELNVIFVNGDRVNIASHINIEAILIMLSKLLDFLPVIYIDHLINPAI